MSLTLGDLDYYERSFPRVSGDEPGAVAHVVWYDWFSPRERG